MTGQGDAGLYPCHMCDSEHRLTEVLDHLATAHPDLTPSR